MYLTIVQRGLEVFDMFRNNLTIDSLNSLQYTLQLQQYFSIHTKLYSMKHHYKVPLVSDKYILVHC